MLTFALEHREDCSYDLHPAALSDALVEAAVRHRGKNNKRLLLFGIASRT